MIDETTGKIYLYNMGVLFVMKSALCDIRTVLCNVKSTLCSMGAL